VFRKFFNIPFYQTHWHGIALEEIYKEIGGEADIKNNAIIYDWFYTKLNDGSCTIEPQFIAFRQTVSQWLEKIMKGLSIQPHDSRILSVGAGLGYIEAPLIEKGYDIIIQECQSKSLEYIEKLIPSQKICFINSPDLTEIKGESFDFVYAYGVCYSLSPEILESFLMQISRVLIPGGMLCIAGDGSYAWNLLKSLIQKHQGIQWGWRRPWQQTVKLAKKHNLVLNRHSFLNDDFEEIIPWTFLKIPLIFGAYQDLFIFKRL
jgi:SAM-dependent methyltransferase